MENQHNKEKDFLQTRFPCDKCGELVRKNLNGTLTTHLCHSPIPHNEEKCCEQCHQIPTPENHKGDIYNAYCIKPDCTCHSPVPPVEETDFEKAISTEWQEFCKFGGMHYTEEAQVMLQKIEKYWQGVLTTQQAKWKADIITALEARKKKHELNDECVCVNCGCCDFDSLEPTSDLWFCNAYSDRNEGIDESISVVKEI